MWQSRSLTCWLRPVLMLGATAAVLSSAAAAERPDPSGTVRIGIAHTLLHDGSERLLLGLKTPFEKLIASQTGLNSELVPTGDVPNLVQRLADGKLDVAVLQGIEFAWAKTKYPDLQPLVLAVNQRTHLRALLVVRADRRIADVRDLREQRLAIPGWCRLHCELFLQRRCRDVGAEQAARFFSRIDRAGSAEDVLDDLVDGKANAALVEEVSFDCYQRRKPGRADRLKILEASQVFPASVVVYRAGKIDAEMLKQFRHGLLAADGQPLGRHLLTLWRLTGFVPVPQDYPQTVTRIVRTYPPPEKGAGSWDAVSAGNRPSR